MLLKKPGPLQSIQLFVHRPGYRAGQAGNLAHMQPSLWLQ
jgi:hypothetical protein